MLNGGLFPERHRPVLTQKLLASPLGGLVARLSSYRTFSAQMKRIWGRTPPSDDELRACWRLVTEGNGLRVMPELIGYIAERKKHRDRWVGALVTLAAPRRFINGMLDPISGAHMVARYRELMPDGDIVELSDVGHYPQLEAADRVEDAAVSFLARC